MKVSREVKVALLVLLGIALFLYLFTFLKGKNIFSDNNTYYTQFDYNALSPSSPVTIKGNKIGKVEDISYDYQTGKTIVEFSVNPKLKFSKNSIARLYPTGLMGGNALSIVDANDGDLAKPGDYIQSEVKQGLMSSLESSLPKVTSGLDGTLESTDTLVNNLNALLQDDSEKGLKNAIAELNTTLKSFASTSYSVQGMIKNNEEKISSILDNFDKTSKDLNALTTELKDAGLSNTIGELNKTISSLQNLLATIDNGEGTLGKLMKDEALYDNLEAASKELQLLLLDIKLHPARYRRILSKKEIPYEEPTEEQINNN
ncbi:MlaD family protein [Winogradskyella sp. SYSU M77433]|uniref:MlaD family protein n=1 Tax=Winogradskyella sp. SYSU M77433 TaxID=3042722 RepID=UPI0024816D57|nr:MlaD family protein [Winogradskyella sp. SYSU M77433]MDH7912586.1 MlaD family protein [Winogradskyella sp. SYSU M77433]